MKRLKGTKVYHRKLVRDNIPNIIKKAGGQYKTRVLNDEAMPDALTKNLREEIDELINADSRKELLSEAADVVITLLALLNLHNYSVHELNKEVTINTSKKGMFDKQLYLIWSTE